MKLGLAHFVMLKGIPKVFSAQLLSALARMGHGDEIVLADANFPSAAIAKHGAELIPADGHSNSNMLRAILKVLPLDTYVKSPAAIMEKTLQDKDLATPIIEVFQATLDAAEKKPVSMERVERFQFYERAKKAFAIVATGETALYGNIILTKGVISAPVPTTKKFAIGETALHGNIITTTAVISAPTTN